ncbi:histidine kinase [Methylomonas lenta]|uniref:Histidine kinase n=1 Tax=Methylomonas lenta TaxID=980561 RepID=A0A177NA00_9GAMM|nr:histidine kinase [Methylomonas lenta]OAI14876.1 histidine kinase [Methylomonas lenta]
MNLQLHLMSRIAAVALICLLASVVYVLKDSEAQSKAVAQRTMNSLAKQLEYQLLMINAGYPSTNPFPDLDLWKQTNNTPGICVQYASYDDRTTRSLCNGIDLSAQHWPLSFEKGYRQLFEKGFEWQHPIAFNGHDYGMLTVTTSIEMAIGHAWNNICHLLTLSIITILAVCLLVYLVVSRALRPAQVIVAGLKRMDLGELSYRLPDFKLIEWQQTAAAINHLAENQQLLLSERQKLAVMLMNVQEEDRRYLARELHDELGQCLAAINAVVTSIKRTAVQQYPVLMPEVEQISRFTHSMQESVRNLLTRLRPPELEELGLEASLTSLVSRWNQLGDGKVGYHLHIQGDCTHLQKSLALTIFRVIQEGISNIAKHAMATNADISLLISAEDISLTIQDDGKVDALPFADSPGIGLLGMRERVTALNGKFALAIAQPHGLLINLWLPKN